MVSMERSAKALVVDDDVAVATVLVGLLRQAGHEARAVTSGEDALVWLDRAAWDVLLTDLRMPGMGGMALLEAARARWPGLPVVMMTAHGSVQLAVEAMRKGAADFIQKPFERDELLYAVGKALAASAGEEGEPAPAELGVELIGRAPAFAAALDTLRRAAQGTATVLVRGESGTGKELAARAVHEWGPRRAGPYVRVHCAALPEALLESELFGHEKGAFTGAVAQKPGRVELAHGGTLFLDEIGDVPLTVQVKLLRVLQEKEFERVGGTRTQKVDVRFVAATHRPLEQLVKAGAFRADLFYRLNVIPVQLPPLRERAGDVPLLVERMVTALGKQNNRQDVALSEDAVALLATQPWPGNVRQLQNLLERLVVLSPAPRIDRGQVEQALARDAALLEPDAREAQAPQRSARDSDARDASHPEVSTLAGRRREASRAAVLEALERANQNRTQAARLLGVSRRTLYNRLEELGLGG